MSKINKRNIVLLIIAAILLALVLNIHNVVNFIGWLYNAFSAVIIGGCIAFVINILTDFFSSKVFKRIEKPKTKTILSLVCSILVIILLMILLVAIIVPQLIDACRLLAQKLPEILNSIQTFSVNLTSRFPEIADKLNQVKASSTNFSQTISHFLKTELPKTLDSTFVLASKTVKSVTTAFIGFMISIYIILSKKRLGIQARELCYGLFSPELARRILYVAHLTSKDFKAFIYGRVFDALIMAAAYLVFGLIFRLPYTLMIASIIAVFSIIPLFGALISWGVGFFLIITDSFLKAILFSVIILSILFITRNFIYPKLIGDSLGLPDLWVLVAVVIGGKLFGLLGMITAVPVFSVLYHILALIVHHNLDEKKVPETDYMQRPDWKNYNEESNLFK